MAIDRIRHRRAMLLPETRRAFAIGKQEGDGAGRQISHGQVDLLPGWHVIGSADGYADHRPTAG
jgi:hypothetical protein